jgi:hypothetical protein
MGRERVRADEGVDVVAMLVDPRPRPIFLLVIPVKDEDKEVE